MQRMDIVQQLQQQLQGAQEQIKKLSGDLQTANRAEVQSRKRTEVEKFKSSLKGHELESKGATKVAINKLENAVKLESEKLRLSSDAQKQIEKSQSKGVKK